MGSSWRGRNEWMGTQRSQSGHADHVASATATLAQGPTLRPASDSLLVHHNAARMAPMTSLQVRPGTPRTAHARTTACTCIWPLRAACMRSLSLRSQAGAVLTRATPAMLARGVGGVLPWPLLRAGWRHVCAMGWVGGMGEDMPARQAPPATPTGLHAPTPHRRHSTLPAGRTKHACHPPPTPPCAAPYPHHAYRRPCLRRCHPSRARPR